MGTAYYNAGAASGTILLLISLLVANLSYSYYKLLPHVEAIQNRKPKVVLLIGLSAFIWVFTFVFVVFYIHGVIPNNDHGFSVALFYSHYNILSLPVLHFNVYRAYIVYFDIKFNVALQDSEWRLFIDPTETNWFLKNKQKWGSGKKVAIILFVMWSVFTIIGVTRAFMILDIDSLCRLVIGLHTIILSVLGLVLYFKFPKFDDIWQIRKEIKLSSLSTSLIVILYLILSAITDVDQASPAYALFCYLGVSATLSPVLASMLFVYYKFKLPWNICTVHRYLQSKSNLLNIKTMQRKDSLTIKMNDILQKEHGFNLFCRHLTREFAMENLLFFIETQQWINYVLATNVSNKQELLQFGDDDDKRFLFQTLFGIKFPDNAPKSKLIASVTNVVGVIVNHDGTVSSSQNDKRRLSPKQNQITTISMDDIKQNDDDPYISAVKIFNKYIANNSYFCVNLSFEQRINLYELFGYNDSSDSIENDMVNTLKQNDMNLKTLLHIFNDARYEAYKLMLGAFIRFKSSDEFVKHFDELAKENSN